MSESKVNLKSKVQEIHKSTMDVIKKSILLKHGSLAAYCKDYPIMTPTRLSAILKVDDFSKTTYPTFDTFLKMVVSLDLEYSLELGQLSIGSKSNQAASTVNIATDNPPVRAQAANMKEAAQMARDEAREREKAEKERRKLWHKDRHKILPDPATNDIKEIHFHLLAMIPVLRDLLGAGTQGIFDLHRDQFGQLAYWITGNGYPHLRIPEDLEQSGQPAFHFNQYVMYSLYKIKPEMVIYANEDEIHYYYNTVFLPQKRILETMLESGVEIENGYHFFGGKKSIYPKKNHPVPRATQSMPDGFRMLVGTPFKSLDHLGWDYENNCATVIPRPITLKWEDAFFSKNTEGVYDEKATD